MQDRAFKNLHCMIVDDHLVTRRAMIAMLRALGVAKVTLALNADDALEKLDTTSRAVDCILSRLWMDEGNGLQLLKAIRSGYARSTRIDTCFILFTATAQPDAIKIAASLDAHGVLVKPISVEKIRNAIINGRARNFAADITRYTTQTVPNYQPMAL